MFSSSMRAARMVFVALVAYGVAASFQASYANPTERTHAKPSFAFSYQPSELSNAASRVALDERLRHEAVRFCRAEPSVARSPVSVRGCQRSLVEVVRHSFAGGAQQAR